MKHTALEFLQVSRAFLKCENKHCWVATSWQNYHVKFLKKSICQITSLQMFAIWKFALFVKYNELEEVSRKYCLIYNIYLKHINE